MLPRSREALAAGEVAWSLVERGQRRRMGKLGGSVGVRHPSGNGLGNDEVVRAARSQA